MNRLLLFLHSLKLRYKLLLTYLVVAVIPLILWLLYSYQQANEHLVSQAQENLRTVYENTANNLNEKTRKVEYALKMYVMDGTIGEVLVTSYDSVYQKYSDIKEKIDSFTATVQTLYPEIVGVTIYSDSDIAGTRIQFRNMEGLEATVEEALSRSAGIVWRLEHGALYAYGNIINLGNSRRVGVARFQVDYPTVFGHNVPDPFSDFQLEVQDAAGQSLYRQEHLSGPVWTENYIAESGILEHTGWRLVLRRAMSAVQIEPGDAFTTVLLAVALSFILLLLMILFFSTIIIQRIDLLKRSVAGVVRNHFQTDLHSEYTDEIGEITNSVGDMIAETRVMIREVYERKIALREAEITALQAQINPHFLYNTLSLINWKAIACKNAEISRLVTTLSTFYRTMLNNGNYITTVQDELANTDAYLEIQFSLHNGDFDTHWEIDPHIMEYNLPNLILQPIVENAIEHGIEKKQDGRGSIWIKGRANGNHIVFEVIDNGPGMRPELIQEVLLNNKKGYGVKNVNDRLKLFFDEEYGLSFSSPPDGGTQVTVTIPRYVHISDT